MTQTIIHAPMINVKVQRKEPSWQTFGPDDRNHLTAYRDLLDALGIEDPSDSGVGHPRRAVDLLQHAVSLRASSRAITRSKSDPDAEMKRKLATGEIDRATWTKHLAKTPTAKDLAEMRQRDADMLGAAGLSAFRIGCRAIREVGEERWLGILHPIVEEAVRTKDQRRWTGVHRLASFLRDPAIAALSRAVSGQAEVPRYYYMFRNWDAVYKWQVERATHTSANSRSAGDYTFVTIGFSINYPPPWPTVADFEPSWGAGLHSAEQAVANSDAIFRRQEDEFDAASPEPRPSTKVFI